MDLDGGKTGSGEGVAQGDRRVRVCTRIDQEPVKGRRGRLDPFDKLSLAIGLARFDGRTQVPRELCEIAIDGLQGVAPIDFRLSRPEEVEVGTVENEDVQASRPSSRRARSIAAFTEAIRSRRSARSGCPAASFS